MDHAPLSIPLGASRSAGPFLRALVVAALLAVGGGCARGPQPPPADLPPDPGYRRIHPPGLRFSVDLPEGWQIVRSGPSRATLRPRDGRWTLALADQPLALERGEPPDLARLESAAVALAQAVAGGRVEVRTREEQRSAWIAGRLLQGEAKDKGGPRLAIVWLGAHDRRAYLMAAVGPRARQLELREVLDHALASLRPRE
jgi:hypothetical protein